MFNVNQFQTDNWVHKVQIARFSLTTDYSGVVGSSSTELNTTEHLFRDFMKYQLTPCS